MRVSAENRDSMFYYVVDKDTGERIHYCLWADDISGEYEAVCLDAEGRVIVNRCEGTVRTEKKVGNIRLGDTRNEKDVLVK